MEDTIITAALLEKYDRPGPRYTSYPTVPEWRDDFDANACLTAFDKARRHEDAPLSLYAHIPFCRSRCAYCGCNVALNAEESVDRYIACLEAELAMTAPMLAPRRRVTQCHWGGGTPTFLNESAMRRLFGAFADYFAFEPHAEIAVETNPASVTESQMRCLRDLGFNRISFGVQDLDPAVQQAICRNQTASQTRAGIELCRELGFRGINVDLIYGLPLQQETGWRRTIDAVIAMRPDRVAIYSYAHLPARFPHQASLDGLPRPDAPQKYALFALARQRLLDAGYAAIGMDHFALPEDELGRALSRGALNRNFMGYTVQHAPDQIGFGASAISEVADCYLQNLKDVDAYCSAVEQGRLPVEKGMQLSRDDVIRRWVIRKLMCAFMVDKELFEQRFGVPFDRYFSEARQALRYYEREGMISEEGRCLKITPLGSVFIRNICMVFDAYLNDRTKEIFSRTI
ncbi:MAG TPA: oxygen-independent coproporphyrinogen III oxidase [Candidatus Hydrogenedentes bacterium]|nr:oxygen-independent coproporphyrinogen III oxidase [Candidatus Hydrogenedentota bacterium]